MNEALNRMPAPAGTEGAGPGARLAEARQAQSLTPADVARQLKLSVWQVEALEAGRYHQLPGPIFVRGFIRNYARLMKLDARELLRDGGDSLPRPEPRREAPPSQEIPFPGRESSRWPLYAAAAVAMIGALAIYEFYWTEPDAIVTSPVARGASASAPPRTEESSERALAPIVASAESPRLGDAAPSVRETEAGTGPSAVPPAAVASSGAERPSRGDEREVMLEFQDESWVEIRDRNERVIFSQLNRPGTQQRVHGLPPFSIVVGNAHGVRLTYDDQPVDLRSHTRIDVARLILP